MTHSSKGDIFRKDSHSEERVPFDAAFPDIAELRVDVWETGEGNSGLGVRRFHKNSIREYLNCSNQQCLGRGFWMGRVLREMVRRRTTTREIHQRCESREESGQPCSNFFTVKVELDWKISGTL